jgi:cob(I)alamin adenosyltransferase
VFLQLELLEKENAEEWGRSERLETGRLVLERENKRLRAEVEDMQEQLISKRSVEAAVLKVKRAILRLSEIWKLVEKTNKMSLKRQTKHFLAQTVSIWRAVENKVDTKPGPSSPGAKQFNVTRF